MTDLAITHRNESCSSLNTYEASFTAAESIPRLENPLLENGSLIARRKELAGEKSLGFGWKDFNLSHFCPSFSGMFHETIREPFHSDC
jgi:hypothetical protein